MARAAPPVDTSATASAARAPDAGVVDVVVVGAGPAGSALALRLAREGVRTLVVERATFPRDKLCGSCLHPRAVAELRALDPALAPAALGAVPLRRARIGARGAWAELPLGGAAVLSRRRLDAALLAAAARAGATVRTGTAARIAGADGSDGWRTVDLEPVGGGGAAAVRARVVVAADGLGTPLLTRARAVAAPPAPGSRVGLGALLDDGGEADVPLGRVDLGVGRDGYVGCARLEDGRLDVAAAVDARALRAHGPGALVARVAGECGLRLPAVAAAAEWTGSPPLTRRVPCPFGHRVLAIGDAAGYVEPFTGEGIAWALAGARVAAGHLTGLLETWTDARAAAWAREQAAELRARRRRCGAVATFVRHPGWVRAAVPVLARSRVLASLVARVGYGRSQL